MCSSRETGGRQDGVCGSRRDACHLERTWCRQLGSTLFPTETLRCPFKRALAALPSCPLTRMPVDSVRVGRNPPPGKASSLPLTVRRDL